MPHERFEDGGVHGTGAASPAGTERTEPTQRGALPPPSPSPPDAGRMPHERFEDGGVHGTGAASPASTERSRTRSSHALRFSRGLRSR